GVEDERPQGRLRVALGRRNALDDGFQDLIDALTGLGAGQDGGGRVKPDGVPDLAEYPLGIGVGQVDLVDHRDDLQVVLQGQVAVGKDRKSTRLNSSHVKISYAVFCL